MKPMRSVVGSAAAITTLVVTACGASSGLSGNAYKTGDCVVVGVDQSGNGTIGRVSCTNPPADFDKAVTVVSGSNSVCTVGDRTFQDQVTNATYCLEDLYNMAAGQGGSSAAASPSPSSSASSGFAFSFCSPAWPALEQMNKAVHAGHVNSFGDMVWKPGVWPGPATISSWNQVLTSLASAANTAGQSAVSSEAQQAQLPTGYNPSSDNGNLAIALGNQTLLIAQACAPGGEATGVSTVDSYKTFDGFTWYPGD